MPLRLDIQIAAVILAIVLGVAIVDAWRADRRDRAQLAGELASAKKALADADTRQHEPDTQLAQTLSALANLKRTIVTPAQIVRELPREIPLPTPITLQSTTAANSPATQIPAGPSLNSLALPVTDGRLSQAVIPAEDLKPLYDFALECKACQAKLTVAQSDLTDERTKTATLAHERDDALRLARGGNVWRRIGRAAKWLVIGAAAGAIAAKASH
jgi:hypothetical protein